MATQFEIDCALMAGAAYASNRSTINYLPAPNGWLDQVAERQSLPSGFEAATFRSGNDIVISYAGTEPTSLRDWFANSDLANGFWSIQLNQAAEYYLSIKNNPLYAGCNISFTGHSLGGGLAALMGVMFGRQAVTFDQAPFANAAELSLLLPDVAGILKQQLLFNGHSDAELSGLTNFIQTRQTNGGGIPNSDLISTIRVAGEFTSSLFPVSAYSPIGAQTVLTHGDALTSFDLHSQALLTTFLQSDAFRQMTSSLPELLGMIFDTNLFAHPTDPNSPDVNLLEHLVRHQAGAPSLGIVADTMLTRFTADLDTYFQAKGGASTPQMLGHALIAFAMEKYYSETTADPSQQAALFKAVTGGLQFDTSKINADITAAKGYQQYFTNYLSSAMFTPDEANQIRNKISTLKDWSIAVGSSGMTASDSQNNGALMIGNFGNDTLTGGTAADLLAEEAANDSVFEMWVAA